MNELSSRISFIKSQMQSPDKASSHFGKTLNKQALEKPLQKINYLMNHWLIRGKNVYELKSGSSLPTQVLS